MILAADPKHAQALHLLGVVEHQQGRSEAAVEHIRAAIERDSRDPAFHHNLGNILAARSETAAAIRCYERALALAPGSPDTLYNLGNAYQEQGRVERAIACYQQALRTRPDVVELHNNLGSALQDAGRLDDAIAAFRGGLALRPDMVELLDNLAVALRAQGRLDEAQAAYERALVQIPQRRESRIGLAAILNERGQYEDAVRCCEHGLALAPDNPGLHNNLGVALVELGRAEAAIPHYRRALAVQPDRAESHNNLGIALEHLGHHRDALDCYAKALALNPDYPAAHFNRAHALLISGELEEGWREYEWRFALAGDDRKFAAPLWSGESLPGQTILIHAEQGFGDTFQFVRYLPAVAARSSRVVLEVPRPLVRLLESLDVAAEIISAGDPLPAFDCHCPLLSLPRVFNTGLDAIPNRVPYLVAEPARIARWRERLPGGRMTVGLAWQGNPEARNDRLRSIPLREFAPIARVPGIRLVSLQKKDGLEQLASLPADVEVAELGADFDAGPEAFLDTAAVMTSLDLVIACDSAVAHLAGALARPLWIFLPHHPDWRWLWDRTDSPWYPTARLFRQERPGNWAGIIERAAAELGRLAG